jgi:DNA helicase-2/ATP-dependent DNA helicase PcrA
MNKNRLIIAAAGSGKTTNLVNNALVNKNQKILITTYTLSNETEIRKKIISKNNFIPENITVQTWFSFLIQHGVKPYQGCLYEKRIKGLYYTDRQSGFRCYYKINGREIPIYFGENKNFEKYYFSPTCKIYSDKLSKFVFRCNIASNGNVIDRISRIYSLIYIDEIQDLAGYDLEIIKLLLQSPSCILMVGDPRQVIYLTHHERKYCKYSNGAIKKFICTECKSLACEIDERSLNSSYRCNQKICDYSSKLYPQYSPSKSEQSEITGHDGIFLVKQEDVKRYLFKYNPIQLRLNVNTKCVDENYEVLNFGESKGSTFDRVLIYPTRQMCKWIINNNTELEKKTRSQFYVAITRAKYSVGIVFNYSDHLNIDGVLKYE